MYFDTMNHLTLTVSAAPSTRRHVAGRQPQNDDEPLAVSSER
jgi:hypothetical protein